MTIVWHDVSIPLRPAMTRWPGDPSFVLAPDQRISEGAESNTSIITLSTHAGTHCDAPWHLDAGGKRLDEIDPAVFFGEAVILELGDIARIRAEDLGPSPLPRRLLLKTRNSSYCLDAPFTEEYTALELDAAQRIANEGVVLAGIDYLSVAPYAEFRPVHHVLLDHGVFIVEGLRLAGLSAGPCQFVALPLALTAADGAPCRAFVGY